MTCVSVTCVAVVEIVNFTKTNFMISVANDEKLAAVT